MRGCDPALEKVKQSAVGSRGRLLGEAAAPLGGASAPMVLRRRGHGGTYLMVRDCQVVGVSGPTSGVGGTQLPKLLQPEHGQSLPQPSPAF